MTELLHVGHTHVCREQGDDLHTWHHPSAGGVECALPDEHACPDHDPGVDRRPNRVTLTYAGQRLGIEVEMGVLDTCCTALKRLGNDEGARRRAMTYLFDRFMPDE